MSEIRMLLKLARRRLELNSFMACVHWAAIVLAASALVLAILDRIPGQSFIAWLWVAPALALVTLVVALVLWSRRRLSELQVALHVDERLDLREKLSTALHCHDRDDPFAQAAVADAVGAARDPRSREMVRRFFAFVAPRRWWLAPLMIVVAALVLQLPQANLFAGEAAAQADEVERARMEADEATEVLVEILEDNDLLKAELGDLTDELTTPGDDLDMTRRPEDIKREALKKVTELNDRLDDLINGEKGKTQDALKDMLSKLESPSDGPGKDLAEALSKGDFGEAKKALEKMLEEAQNGNLSDQQKAEMAAALESLGQQMEKLAQQQKELEDALKKAGMNPQLANNPEALKQALEQAQNLNEQQKQQLQQMVQAQQQAQQMCKAMGGACKQMGQGMKAGKMGQGGQMMEQLGAMEQMQMMLQQAEAAAGQCQGMGMGQGMNLDQAMQEWKQGNGMGSWGAGRGGKAPLKKTPTGSQMKQAKVPSVEGEIIASMLIDGTPMAGESRATRRKVVEAVSRGFEEGIEEEPLPRQYQDAQKHFFGELQRKIEAIRAAEEATEDGGAPTGPGSGSGSGAGAAGDAPSESESDN